MKTSVYPKSETLCLAFFIKNHSNSNNVFYTEYKKNQTEGGVKCESEGVNKRELEKENPESEAVYGDSFWAEITLVKEDNDEI